MRPADVARQSARALDSAMNTIHHMARYVTATTDTLADWPAHAEAAFGLKLDMKASALIASTLQAV